MDGEALSFLITDIRHGSVTKTGSAVVAGTTLISNGESVVWTPTANINGLDSPISVKAYDGIATSATALVQVVLTPVADGAIWDGAEDPLWSDGSSWLDNTVPANGEVVTFNGGANFSIDLNGNRSVGGINFGGNDAFTLANNTITLAQLGSIITSNPSSGGVMHSINSALALQGEATINTSNLAALTLSGALTGTETLTKTGAGTLTWSGSTSSFTGNTTISAGTLSMSLASLADAADLSIATGATLNLEFSGTDTIRALDLGGVQQAGGIWGSPASDAPNKSSLITGSGLTTWRDASISSTSSASDPNGVTVTITENGNDPDTVVVSISTGTNTRLFSRLSATGQ